MRTNCNEQNFLQQKYFSNQAGDIMLKILHDSCTIENLKENCKKQKF